MSRAPLGIARASLGMSQPGDPLEREADAVADQVMRMSNLDVALLRPNFFPSVANFAPRASTPAAPAANSGGEGEALAGVLEADPAGGSPTDMGSAGPGALTGLVAGKAGAGGRRASPQIQRACASCEDDLQRLPLGDEKHDEEELRAEGAPGGPATAVSPATAARVQAARGGGAPLSPVARGTLEPRFGHDFGAVRVHADDTAAHLNAELRARAFTLGRDLFFGAGQYQPGTRDGQRLIAHELTHVLQQDGDAPPVLARKPSGWASPRRSLTVPIPLGPPPSHGGGRPLAAEERALLPAQDRGVGRAIRVEETPETRAALDARGMAGALTGDRLLLGAVDAVPGGRKAVLAHELAHALQRRAPSDAPLASDPERGAAAYEARALQGKPAQAPLDRSDQRVLPRVVWSYKQDVDPDMLLIADLDDGDFVGGCVKQIVPHAGLKLVKKGVPKGLGNQVFDIHVGVMTDATGQECVFFYESVTGMCETLCYSSKEELKKDWEKIVDWVIERAQQIADALRPLLGPLAYIAAWAIILYCIAQVLPLLPALLLA